MFNFNVKLTSYSDEALNKRYADKGSLFCVLLFSCIDFMYMVVIVRFRWLTIGYGTNANQTCIVFVNVSTWNRNVSADFSLLWSRTIPFPNATNRVTFNYLLRSKKLTFYAVSERLKPFRCVTVCGRHRYYRRIWKLGHLQLKVLHSRSRVPDTVKHLYFAVSNICG